jgi:hypothetical protein
MSHRVASKDSDVQLLVNFVTPSKPPEPVDVTPPPSPYEGQPADPSLKAIAASPERRRGPHGLWLEETPTSMLWMK